MALSVLWVLYRRVALVIAAAAGGRLSHCTAACRPEFSSRLLSGTGIRPFPTQAHLPAAAKLFCAIGLNLHALMRLIRMDLFKLEDDQTKAKFSVVLFEFGCCELFNVCEGVLCGADHMLTR